MEDQRTEHSGLANSHREVGSSTEDPIDISLSEQQETATMDGSGSTRNSLSPMFIGQTPDGLLSGDPVLDKDNPASMVMPEMNEVQDEDGRSSVGTEALVLAYSEREKMLQVQTGCAFAVLPLVY